MPDLAAAESKPDAVVAPANGLAPRWRDLIAGVCVAGLLLPEAVA